MKIPSGFRHLPSRFSLINIFIDMQQGHDQRASALFVARVWRTGMGKGVAEKTGVTSEKTSEKILAIIRPDRKVAARHGLFTQTCSISG
jgi:hypothetical protein